MGIIIVDDFHVRVGRALAGAFSHGRVDHISRQAFLRPEFRRIAHAATFENVQRPLLRVRQAHPGVVRRLLDERPRVSHTVGVIGLQRVVLPAGSRHVALGPRRRRKDREVSGRAHVPPLALSDVEICYLPADHGLFDGGQILGSINTVRKDPRCAGIGRDSRLPFGPGVRIVRTALNEQLPFGHVSGFLSRLGNSFGGSVPLYSGRQRAILKDLIAACVSAEAFRIRQLALVVSLALIARDSSVHRRCIFLILDELLLDFYVFVLNRLRVILFCFIFC